MSEQIFHEKVFFACADTITINNAPFKRICPKCNDTIGARSVHQIRELGCVETKIHVHKYYQNTGNCIFPNCCGKISLEYISKLTCDGRIRMLATKGDVERIHELYE